MITKRTLWLILMLILCFGLIAYAPAAEAAERFGPALSKDKAVSSGGLQVKVQQARWGNLPVEVVVYDQDWNVIEGADLVGGVHTFSGLSVGDYHVLAEADAGETSLAENVPVFAHQTTQVDLLLARPALPAAATTAAAKKSSCGNVSGDGSIIKVAPFYNANIIYLQCGHVVGKIKPAACGCSAGKWRYTTDCQKTAPIYVTLPCFGK
jgi:hypothetical protein